MQTQLFSHFLSALETLVAQVEEAVSSSKDAYALGAVALACVGATADTAYQALPKMRPRTVRYILASDAGRMCLFPSFEGTAVHKATIEEGTLEAIRDQAEAVQVAPGIAEAAVTRYGNSPERVTRVLDDLTKLLAAGGKVFNPTGLFTRLMRSGEDLRLPARVLQAAAKAEEQKKRKQEEAEKPVPAVGMLVRWYGEVCRIVELTRQFAHVENDSGDVCNVPLDRLRFI